MCPLLSKLLTQFACNKMGGNKSIPESAFLRKDTLGTFGCLGAEDNERPQT